MKTFNTQERELFFREKDLFVKRPLPIRAVQINEPFRVRSLEGDYAQGSPGDYLLQGIKGELYICNKQIFEESYTKIS